MRYLADRQRHLVWKTLVLSLLISSAYADDFGKVYVDSQPDAAVYLNPDLATWIGDVTFRYNTNGIIPIHELVDHIEWVTGRIEKRVSVSFRNQGSTNANVNGGGASPPMAGALLIEVINHAEMLSLYGDYSGFAWIWWDSNNRIIGAEIAVNADYVISQDCWRGVLNHEFGHALNLDHPDIAESVMNPDASCFYQKTLRRNDIVALHAMYPYSGPNFEPELMDNECLYAPNISFEGTNYEVQDVCHFTAEGISAR
jgi:hypothetical protein